MEIFPLLFSSSCSFPHLCSGSKALGFLVLWKDACRDIMRQQTTRTFFYLLSKTKGKCHDINALQTRTLIVELFVFLSLASSLLDWVYYYSRLLLDIPPHRRTSHNNAHSLCIPKHNAMPIFAIRKSASLK